MIEPSLNDISAAARRIAPYIHRTPIFTSRTIDALAKARIYFKCENLQKTGAFKIRGATNAVFLLSEQQALRGVATHSSGNHGAALAQAARWRGIKATVVMPHNAPDFKKRAVVNYGADIFSCESTLTAREDTLSEVIDKTGAVFIPPYNDYRVIAGQATVALEFFEELANLDAVFVPIGGGGLISGTALVAHTISPRTKVLGAEPANADDAHHSFKARQIMPVEKPQSIADGLLTSLGTLTFPIIERFVNDIVTVSEEQIITAMRCIWDTMKLIVEPSAAVPLGALLNHQIDVTGKRVGVILSGGNVDLDRLPW